MNATRLSSDISKNAIIKNMINIIMANTNQAHLAPELLKLEKVPKASTTQIAKIINCTKLTENPIMEKADHEKNHFLICCGNITFMNIAYM